MMARPSRSPLFPYTTLFRSAERQPGRPHAATRGGYGLGGAVGGAAFDQVRRHAVALQRRREREGRRAGAGGRRAGLFRQRPQQRLRSARQSPRLPGDLRPALDVGESIKGAGYGLSGPIFSRRLFKNGSTSGGPPNPLVESSRFTSPAPPSPYTS